MILHLSSKGKIWLKNKPTKKPPKNQKKTPKPQKPKTFQNDKCSLIRNCHHNPEGLEKTENLAFPVVWYFVHSPRHSSENWVFPNGFFACIRTEKRFYYKAKARVQDFKSAALKLPSEFCGNDTSQHYMETTKIIIKTEKSVPLKQIHYQQSLLFLHPHRKRSCLLFSSRCQRLSRRNGYLGRHLGCPSFLTNSWQACEDRQYLCSSQTPSVPVTLGLGWERVCLMHTETGGGRPQPAGPSDSSATGTPWPVPILLLGRGQRCDQVRRHLRTAGGRRGCVSNKTEAPAEGGRG